MNRATAISRRLPRDAGLTLVELLVALALASLTMTLLPGALRLANRAWEAQAELERSSEVALALHAIEQRLASAQPVYEVDTRLRSVAVAFKGTATMLEFVSASESGPAGGGLYRWLLAPVDADRTGLSLYVHPYTAARTEAHGETRALLRSGASVRFRYHGLQGPDTRRAQWHSDWSRTDALPELVEIHVQALPQARIVERRHVVALRLVSHGSVRTP